MGSCNGLPAPAVPNADPDMAPVVAVAGPRRLLARIAVLFGAALAGGMLLLLFWPAGAELAAGVDGP